VTKRRRGSRAHLQADSPEGAQHLVDRIADELGIGIIVEAVEDGPPCRITAFLNFGILQTEVTAEGPDEAAAWRELARAAASWRQSNEVSFTRNFWGG
jgi:hypothetical protein